MRIIFFGTSQFAVPILEKLIEELDFKVLAIVTNPDKPAGRKKILSPPPVKILAQRHNIPIFQPHSLKIGALKNLLEIENPVKMTRGLPRDFSGLKLKIAETDICVVASYGKIIPKEYLEIPKFGFVNVHPSLLPKYRGPSPVQTAILNGDTEIGVTIMLMDEQVDHGPILAQKTYNLQPTTYNIQASEELFELGAKLLIETLPKYLNGELKPKEQDHSQATFTKMFTREDGRINWDSPAQEIYNRIRALNPEPGTWTLLRSSGASEGQAKIINIKKAELRDGKIHIQTIQMEGKKEMSFEEFIRGCPDFDISQLK